MGRLHDNKDKKPEATFKGRLFESKPVKEPGLLSKVGGVAKNIATGAIKPFAELGTSALNVGQIAVGAKETQPFSGKFLGDVDGLGKVDITKSPLQPDNLKTIKKSAGVGAEIGSTIAGGGVVKDALGNVIKPSLKRLAVEGAGLGATNALGTSLTEDLGVKDTLKNVALGGAIGAVAGPAVGGVGRLFKGKAKTTPIIEEATEKVVNTADSASVNKNLILPKQDTPLLLEAKNKRNSTLGDNFSFTDQADPAKIQATKLRQNYDTKLKSYNQNPTPAKLRGVLKAKDALENPTPVYNTNIPEAKPIRTTSVVKMPNPKKGDTITKVSRDINTKLVDDGFNKLLPEEQARFNSASRAKQVEDITNLMDSNLDESVSMAVSGKNIPPNIDSQILFNAVKNYATETADVDLQRALAKSPIASQRSVLAQKLGAAATLNDPSDAVTIMSNLNKELEETVGKKLGKKVVEVADEDFTTVQKLKPKISRQSFSEFINSIKC